MSSAEAHLASRIGEIRIAVMDRGRLLEMRVARASDGIQPGAVVGARLHGDGMAEALGEPLALARPPVGAAEGALGRVEVVRAAIPERHRRKPARGLWHGPAEREGLIEAAPSLADGLAKSGIRVREGWPEAVAAAWAEGWEEAELGEIRLRGGRLSLVPTPAGVAVDVDGGCTALAAEATTALAKAIRRWDIGGNVLVDFPRLDRAARLMVAERLDSELAGVAFERTAINGFGLLQIVLPRARPSILERAWFERGANLAFDLLEAAIRDPRPGSLRLFAPPAASSFLGRHRDLVAEAARQAGRPLDVVPLAAAGTGHVATA
jgi:ribonuclease G